MITLRLKEQPSVPLEAEALSPDVIASLGLDAIRALPLHLGKRQHRLTHVGDELQHVEGGGDQYRLSVTDHQVRSG